MKTLLICLLLCFSFNGHATEDLIQLKAGQTQFKIQLSANPTTGFQWSVVNYDHKIFNLIKSQFQRPQTKRIGAGGQMIYIFQVKQAKKYPACTKILFNYARPWEKSDRGSMKQVRVCFYKH